MTDSTGRVKAVAGIVSRELFCQFAAKKRYDLSVYQSDYDIGLPVTIIPSERLTDDALRTAATEICDGRCEKWHGVPAIVAIIRKHLGVME